MSDRKVKRTEAVVPIGKEIRGAFSSKVQREMNLSVMPNKIIT